MEQVKLAGKIETIACFKFTEIITNLHGRKWSSQLYATSVVISVT